MKTTKRREHTATPWTEYKWKSGQSRVGIQPLKSNGTIGPIIPDDGSVSPENAAFIVLACNNFDALLEATKACLKYGNVGDEYKQELRALIAEIEGDL